MSITLWKPEPDVVLHQALGKLAEECAELSQAVARCLIQGYHEEEPVTHKLNRTQLMEEIADVKAAMRWLFDVLDEPFKGESERESRKFDGFKRWQAMLEQDQASDTSSAGYWIPDCNDPQSPGIFWPLPRAAAGRPFSPGQSISGPHTILNPPPSEIGRQHPSDDAPIAGTTPTKDDAA